MDRIKCIVEASEIDLLPGETLFIDCRFDLKDPSRGESAYKEGHLPGATYAHLDRDLSGPKTQRSGRHPLPAATDFQKRLEEWGVSNASLVIAYDDSDMSFAARLWWLLRYFGHEKVFVLNGGLSSYLKLGRGLDTSIPQRTRGRFTPSLQRSMLVEVGEIADQICLVDSRDPARYRGEVEPIDPVAGHIPQALNLFYRENIQEDGRFKPQDQIKKRLAQISSTDRPTFYCGSGVTACVNVLASVYAGLPMPKLYAGSWSEWIRDPARPVERG